MLNHMRDTVVYSRRGYTHTYTHTRTHTHTHIVREGMVYIICFSFVTSVLVLPCK